MLTFSARCQAPGDPTTYRSGSSWFIEGEREADNKLSHYMLCTLMEGASAPVLEGEGCALEVLGIQCRGGRLREREACQFPDNVFL